MPEPHLPVPGPEPYSNWDPKPPRCPNCGTIIDVRDRTGRCPTHGVVQAVYRNFGITPDRFGEDAWCPTCSKVVTPFDDLCPECGTAVEEQGTGDDDPYPDDSIQKSELTDEEE